MDSLDLDQFTEIMDQFLERHEVKMLLAMPAGTQEVVVEDNVGLGAVVHFFILLNAINPILTKLFNLMDIDRDSAEWERTVDTMLGMVKAELMGRETGHA